MSIREFLSNPEWDTPFFKRLAHNDTGRAVGHQAGMVLPKDLRHFLPTLDESATSEVSPTIDRYLRAEMFVGPNHLADGTVRYQFQTWGGTRAAESRLTDGFAPLRDRAVAGDLLLFQRRAEALNRYRLLLVKQGTPEFAEISTWIGTRKWGPLFVAEQPVTQNQLTQARSELVTLADKPFEVVKPTLTRVETRQSRIARSSVFRERVRFEYGYRCAISGILMATPTALYEVESAHVVPVSGGGSDDIRNGLALTHSLHWAFDRGLFGILSSRKVYIPRCVMLMSENSFLKQFADKLVVEAKTTNLRVHADALRWHFENRVEQWD